MPEAIARGSSHGFVALPAALLRELPQPGGQRRLIAYALIHAHGNGSARGCFAALGTLAREAGLSERTVKRAIAELLERGWIQRELRPGHSNRYWALSTPRLTAGNRVAASERQGEQGLLTASSASHPAVSSEVPYPGQHSTPFPGHDRSPTQASRAPTPRPPEPDEQEPINKNPGTRSQFFFQIPTSLFSLWRGRPRRRQPGRCTRQTKRPQVSPATPLTSCSIP